MRPESVRNQVEIMIIRLPKTLWVLLLVGCEAVSNDPRMGEPIAQFDSIFTLSETIRFDEGENQFIARLHEVVFSPTGDTVAVLDPMMHRVRLHDRSGKLLAWRGGPDRGDGPGEFNVPMSIEWDGLGGLWVSEQLNPRITRLTGGLEVDTLVTFSEGIIVNQIDRITDGRLLFRMPGRPDGFQLVIYDVLAGTLEAFKEPHARAREPYWVQFGGETPSASEAFIVSAFSMEYPIQVFTPDGELVDDSLGSEPGSWRQASLPGRGAFAIGPGGGVRSNPGEWRRSFTRVAHTKVIGASCLLVVHEVPDPDEPTMLIIDHRADLYHIPSRRKLAEDMELPGSLVGATGSSLAFLVDMAPAPWTIELWTLDGVTTSCLGG